MSPVESEHVEGVALLVVPCEDDVALVRDVQELHGEGEVVSGWSDGPHVLALLDGVDVDGAVLAGGDRHVKTHGDVDGG